MNATIDEIEKLTWDVEAAEGWLEGFALRSGVTVAELRTAGMDVFPCVNCDYEGCEGWQCVSVESAKLRMRHLGRY